MTRAMTLKAATFQKARKAQIAVDRKAEAERRRKQREWDNFEPMAYGSFGGNMKEYDEIIDRARENHQNVFFGDGAQTQIRNPMGYLRRPTPEVDPFAWVRPILNAFKRQVA